MKHLEIATIVEKRLEKIDAAFNNARLQLNQDDIRVFRVKVKKLAAFLRLVNAAKAQGHPIKLPRKMLKVYRLYGAVRTLQLQQSHIHHTIKGKAAALPGSYLKYLAAQVLLHTAEINKHLKGPTPFRKEAEKLLKLLPKQLSPETMQLFVRSEGDRLEKLFSPVFPADRSFHQARKLLKELLYSSPYLDMEMSDISSYTLLASYEAIDDFTDLLGGFHDFDTALACLHASAPAIEMDEQEKAILRVVECAWAKEREAYRKKIYDEIQKINVAGRNVESLLASR